MKHGVRDPWNGSLAPSAARSLDDVGGWAMVPAREVTTFVGSAGTPMEGKVAS